MMIRLDAVALVLAIAAAVLGADDAPRESVVYFAAINSSVKPPAIPTAPTRQPSLCACAKVVVEAMDRGVETASCEELHNPAEPPVVGPMTVMGGEMTMYLFSTRGGFRSLPRQSLREELARCGPPIS